MASTQLQKLIAAYEARSQEVADETLSDEETVALYRSGTDGELLLVDGIAPTLSPDTTVTPVSAGDVPCCSTSGLKASRCRSLQRPSDRQLTSQAPDRP